jgi:hypothetical protein
MLRILCVTLASHTRKTAKPSLQWQELQLLAEQPLQDEAPEPILLLAAPLSPPLLKPNTDITLPTSSDSHFGQFTASSLLKSSLSNFSQHLQHSYS